MKAGLSVSLGFLFVGLAAFNLITMLQSSRSAQAPRTRARAITLHRIGGYLFLGLFSMLVWVFIKRLLGSPEAMGWGAPLHICPATLVARAFFFLIIICRAV